MTKKVFRNHKTLLSIYKIFLSFFTASSILGAIAAVIILASSRLSRFIWIPMVSLVIFLALVSVLFFVLDLLIDDIDKLGQTMTDYYEESISFADETIVKLNTNNDQVENPTLKKKRVFSAHKTCLHVVLISLYTLFCGIVLLSVAALFALIINSLSYLVWMPIVFGFLSLLVLTLGILIINAFIIDYEKLEESMYDYHKETISVIEKKVKDYKEQLEYSKKVNIEKKGLLKVHKTIYSIERIALIILGVLTVVGMLVGVIVLSVNGIGNYAWIPIVSGIGLIICLTLIYIATNMLTEDIYKFEQDIFEYNKEAVSIIEKKIEDLSAMPQQN